MGGKSGGGEQTVGYWYRLGCQTAVSHSPVDGVSQIIFGERTAWSGFNSGGDIYIDRMDLFGGEKREGGVKGRVAINMGYPIKVWTDMWLPIVAKRAHNVAS